MPLDAPPSEYEMPTKAEIDEVIQIAAEATSTKTVLVPQTRLEKRLEKLGQQILSHAIHAALIMAAAAGMAIYTHSRPWANTVMAMAVITNLLAVATFIPVIILGVMFTLEMSRSPYKPFLGLVAATVDADFPYAARLARCKKPALQYVLAYYKYQRNGYERRAGWITGAVDRMGLVPAFAAWIIMVSNLAKVSWTSGWGEILGPLILAFYFMGLASAAMTHKVDRTITLLELGILMRK